VDHGGPVDDCGPVDDVVKVLMLSGSLRRRSTNTAVLRSAQLPAPEGILAVLYDGLGVLPHFNPDDDLDRLHPAVADLRGRIGAADALLLSTPEYAGTLPGAFKNLLDWTVGDAAEGSIYRKPVAWINAAGRRGEGAQRTLRVVLDYVGAEVVEEACLDVVVTASMVDGDGLVSDPEVRRMAGEALVRLASSAAATRAERSGP
jgi:NAD(P)H-dependent FMN reductase